VLELYHSQSESGKEPQYDIEHHLIQRRRRWVTGIYISLLKTVLNRLEQVNGCAIVGIQAICCLVYLGCQKKTNIGEKGTHRK
jgi:hypothetical protein